MRKMTTTALLAVLTAGAVNITQAYTADGAALSERVSYSDLDLSQAAGAKSLYQRLAGAAKHVCAPLESKDVGNYHRHEVCVQQALSASVARIGNPLLSKYYESKGGERLSSIAQVARQP
jgi:UrcA family protein